MAASTVNLFGNDPVQTSPMSLADLGQQLAQSRTFAWSLIVGLPLLGIVASLLFGLPLFAALMAGCFLLATASVGQRAMATFTGKALQLFVTARLVIILVLGALLFCASGSAWMGVVSAVLLWLTSDRLLGQRALHDLRNIRATTDEKVVPAQGRKKNRS